MSVANVDNVPRSAPPGEPDWEQISKDHADNHGVTIEQVERAYERWAYGE